MEDRVFAIVRKRAATYRALADVYDEALRLAHIAGHGTPGSLEHMRRANAIAPAVMESLEDYKAAVSELLWFLSTQSASERRGGRACPGP